MLNTPILMILEPSVVVINLHYDNKRRRREKLNFSINVDFSKIRQWKYNFTLKFKCRDKTDGNAMQIAWHKMYLHCNRFLNSLSATRVWIAVYFCSLSSLFYDALRYKSVKAKNVCKYFLSTVPLCNYRQLQVAYIASKEQTLLTVLHLILNPVIATGHTTSSGTN